MAIAEKVQAMKNNCSPCQVYELNSVILNLTHPRPTHRERMRSNHASQRETGGETKAISIYLNLSIIPLGIHVYICKKLALLFHVVLKDLIRKFLPLEEYKPHLLFTRKIVMSANEISHCFRREI
jgi:hypothetical protein